MSLVVAELMGSTEGIGYMIMDARQFSNTDIVFVGIIIFAFVGKFSDSLVRLLEVKFLRWRDNFKGEIGKLTYKLLGVIYIEYFSVCFNINKGVCKGMELLWFIPAYGDGRYLGTTKRGRAAEYGYYKQVAQATDYLGYTGVLLPTGQGCEDPWVLASALAAEIREIKVFSSSSTRTNVTDSCSEDGFYI